MQESDLKTLAEQFMMNAVEACEGDNIWVEYVGDEALPLAQACTKKLESIGAKGQLVDSSGARIAQLLKDSSDQQLEAEGARRLALMKTMAGYIRIGDDFDVNKAGIPMEEMRRYQGLVMKKTTDHRVRFTRWLVVKSPSVAFAKACGMNLPEFEAFYRDVCLVDYKQMTDAGKPLKDYMTRAENVRLTGEGTDISFSIKGLNAKLCTGKRNIPDGECYSAPTAGSVNGHITYGPSNYWGVSFPWIRLECEQGRIIKAVSASDELTEKLNMILDTDHGARGFGEFAIAFNPKIRHPTGNILFDEKIDGSIHLTPGQCYEDVANNGNKSKIHWDMVKIQRPDYGGGNVYMNDELIRENGIFRHKDMLRLNPQNLLR